MTTTELRERVTTMQGMVDVLKSLEDEAECYMTEDEETGLKMPPEPDTFWYQKYTGLKACASIIKKELEKKF